MPFDGKPRDYEAKPKTDHAVSVADLAAWLETQPANGEYCYTDMGGCLLHQYFTARGKPIYRMYSNGSWRDFSGQRRPYPRELNGIALRGSYTYGAALERCRRYLAAA